MWLWFSRSILCWVNHIPPMPPCETQTRTPGRGGDAAVPSKKEAAAEEARTKAIGFELWSKVRASQWGLACGGWG